MANKVTKERIDVLLTSKGLIETREKARKTIMAGLVKVNNEIVDKPGTKVPVDGSIEIKSEIHPFVSRGGLKLLKAIKSFNLNLNDKIVIDIGASTGGFTDCSLQYGAKEVYAVDVGYGQLAWGLRQDHRVHVLERTNFRYLKKESLISSPPNFATIDVSFISLKIILEHLLSILETDGEVIALIKPQFEAGKEYVGKKGIVKEPKTHEKVLKEIIAFSLEIGYTLQGLTFSPIKGGEGNIEFLIYLKNKNSEKKVEDFFDLIINTINDAHQNLS